ncbi:PROTEIN SWEETIE, partial [Salix viminalis]
MSKNLVRENVPLSRFGVLVAQLESIGASASQQSPDPLLSFDLPPISSPPSMKSHRNLSCYGKEKCEDALYSLLKLGSRRPVRHLASVAMAKIISRGIVFRYTPERVVSKGFFLMLREANLKELP